MPRLLALVLVALLSPFAAAPAPSASPRTTTVNAPAARTDAQIDALIRTKLAKSKIGKDGFKFHVARGIVTWEGTTDVVQHKGSATRMARTAGAVSVVNNIQVSSAGRNKAAAQLKHAKIVQ
jgi:hypothetical protein